MQKLVEVKKKNVKLIHARSMARKIKAWLETYVLWWISCVLLYQLYQINVNLSLPDIWQGLIAFYLYFILLEGLSFYFCRLCSTALMVGWCEIAEYRSLSYTYFSKEKIETGFHLFPFLREFAFYFNYTIVVILFFMHSHSTP